MTSRQEPPHPYFSDEVSSTKRVFYFALLGLTLLYSTVSLLSPLTVPACDIPLETPHARVSGLAQSGYRRLVQGLEGGLEDAPNPSYQPDPCRHLRYLELLWMTKWEADMTRRIVMSIIMGSIIGFERRRADRPAGIRTMAMVCLGACVFTLTSMFAFVDGTMGWDASRVSAAIPSGVGFLGAASIWKGTKGTGDNQIPEVHGLTTATSIWMAAAVGILCGGGLFVPGLFTTSIGVVYLRFAPRLTLSDPDTDLDIAGSTNDLEGAGSSLLQPLNPSAVEGAGARAPVVRTPSRTSKNKSSPAPFAHV